MEPKKGRINKIRAREPRKETKSELPPRIVNSNESGGNDGKYTTKEPIPKVLI
jgi:hypothetical protein